MLDSLQRLSDDELVARLRGLAARERRATALLVAHLAELDTRDVYLRAGYSSLFAYCRGVLELSEHEALNRIEAARTARRFPVVLDLLAAGEVHLTAVRLLGPHLTAENHARVLESARGRTKGEIEEIVASLSPRPDVPASVRKLPESKLVSAVLGTPKPGVLGMLEPGDSLGAGGTAFAITAPCPSSDAGVPPPDTRPGSPPVAPAAPAGAVPPSVAAGGTRFFSGPAVLASPHSRHSAEIRPLSPGRYRYQLTIGGSTLEKLRLAKDMLRHALPSGDDEVLLDRALTVLLTELTRKRFGAERKESSSASGSASSGTAGPGLAQAGAPGSRYVPIAVKRTVWVRDLGRCAFVSKGGRRCDERAFLEFHHVRPWAVGGEATVENIQLRCRRHNGYEARLFFARDTAEEAAVPFDITGRGRQREERRAISRSWHPSTESRVVPKRVAGRDVVPLEPHRT